LLLATLTREGARVARLADPYGEATTLRGHRQQVLDAAFSADNQRLATASADGTIRVFTLAWSKLIARLSGAAACLDEDQRVGLLGEARDAAARAAAACERSYLLAATR
jgi:WD40 repeat protein